jgi:hypothetical protein
VGLADCGVAAACDAGGRDCWPTSPGAGDCGDGVGVGSPVGLPVGWPEGEPVALPPGDGVPVDGVAVGDAGAVVAGAGSFAVPIPARSGSCSTG